MRCEAVCAASAACTYVDATAWFDTGKTDLMAADGLNPTQSGQRVLSKKFLDVLPELGQ